MNLSVRDEFRMRGVHPALSQVVQTSFKLFPAAFSDAPSLKLFVIEGVRTIERQREYFKSGASHTMNSRHLTGHAVDLGMQADGGMRWEFPLYRRLWEDCMKPAALQHGVDVEWGGEAFGPDFRDGPHF